MADVELVCVVEVGHAPGVPADWYNADDPRHAVCEHHRAQYATAYDDDLRAIEWRAI